MEGRNGYWRSQRGNFQAEITQSAEAWEKNELSVKQQEGQYATFEVSHKSKVDNRLAKVCKKIKDMKTKSTE